MNSKQVEIVQKFMSVLKNPPTVKLDENVNLDEPVIVIDSFIIRDTNEVKITGTSKVQGFALDIATYRGATRWEPEEHDYQELYADTCFTNIAAEAVRKYASYQIDNLLDNETWEAMAKEQEEARQTDNNAYNEGHIACKEGKAENANPYPYGSSVYYKWRQGWTDAESITFKEYKKAGFFRKSRRMKKQ